MRSMNDQECHRHIAVSSHAAGVEVFAFGVRGNGCLGKHLEQPQRLGAVHFYAKLAY